MIKVIAMQHSPHDLLAFHFAQPEHISISENAIAGDFNSFRDRGSGKLPVAGDIPRKVWGNVSASKY
jgi:hypothetical protein